jgi:hypothetical protein
MVPVTMLSWKELKAETDSLATFKQNFLSGAKITSENQDGRFNTSDEMEKFHRLIELEKEIERRSVTGTLEPEQ